MRITYEHRFWFCLVLTAINLGMMWLARRHDAWDRIGYHGFFFAFCGVLSLVFYIAWKKNKED